MLNTRSLASAVLVGLSLLAGVATAQESAAPAAAAPAPATLTLPAAQGLETDNQ